VRREAVRVPIPTRVAEANWMMPVESIVDEPEFVEPDEVDDDFEPAGGDDDE
jgi:hypothetical protein